MQIRKDIYSKLSEIEGAAVYFGFPQRFNKMPVISYFEKKRNDSGICGGGVLTEIEIQVEIRNKGTVEALLESVDEKMTEMGFIRSFCQDMFDTDKELNLKITRYKGILNNADGRIYSSL
ncbi:MAG: hypothetical protein IJ583_14425 [Firmicutes bacterium]|nr:hypothetical protein [Bacillota bacterium]